MHLECKIDEILCKATFLAVLYLVVGITHELVWHIFGYEVSCREESFLLALDICDRLWGVNAELKQAPGVHVCALCL